MDLIDIDSNIIIFHEANLQILFLYGSTEALWTYVCVLLDENLLPGLTSRGNEGIMISPSSRIP